MSGGPACEDGGPDSLRVEIVDLVPDGVHEIVTTSRGCGFNIAEQADVEIVWKWRLTGFQPIAAGSFYCVWTGDTSGESDAPNAPWVCSGSRLLLGPNPGGLRSVTLLEHGRRSIQPRRMNARHRLAPVTSRRLLRWDAEAFRLVPQ
ncbi:MAG: hypothetical protein IT379_42440 [Deltaproteobacteria bacterium]|nr:hypothetical protein [Deltaproteobacteria bacterium]